MRRTLLCVLVSVPLVATPWAHADKTLEDGDFDTPDWLEVVAWDTSGTLSYSVSHVETGGSPDAWRGITHLTSGGHV